MINFTNLVGFAILYFVAINLSTVIVIQFALPLKYAWIPYTVTTAIVTIICVIVAPNLTWLEIGAGVGTAAAVATAAPILPVAAAVGAGAAGVGLGAAWSGTRLPDSPVNGGFLKLLGGRRRKIGGGVPKLFNIPFY